MLNAKRNSILLLSPINPYPTSDGGRICIFGFVDKLRFEYDFTLLIPVYSESDNASANELKAIWPNVNIVTAILYDPIIESTSIKSKLIDIARRIFSKKTNSKPDLLNDIGFVFPFKPFSMKYMNVLEKTLKNEFDIIQVSLTYMLNLVTILPSKSALVFEEMESRFGVLSDYIDTLPGEDKLYKSYLIDNCEQMSNYYISKFDAVFALNEKDLNYFNNTIPDTKVYNSPFGILDKDLTSSLSSTQPNKIVFSGNEGHYPNYDAVIWYLENVHELVNEKVDLSLHITGNWSESTINDIKDKYNKVIFEGFVEDYTGFLQNSIMIVPIRIGGGGIRTKILYAMGNGVPVISSSLGAYGIEAEANKEILVADEATDFCARIVEVVNDKKKLRSLVESGYNLIQDKYSQSATSQIRSNFYKQILDNKTHL